MSVSRQQAVQIASLYADRFGAEFSDDHNNPFDGDGPAIVEGAHEEVSADWIMSWEEGPYEWVFSEELNEIVDRVSNGRAYAQPVNSWCVAFYAN